MTVTHELPSVSDVQPTPEQLKAILEAHGKWFRGEPGCSRANLGGADLYGANLRDANLGGADLYGANLRDANLGGADLRGADLRGADLRDANLGGADLRGADLRGADLRGANLRGADLYGANLRGADLRDANLGGADLRGADLRGADLRGANLRGADLRDANLGDEKQQRALLSLRQVVPESGAFEGWKRLCRGHIAHIQIPDGAARVGGLVGRKCRAETAIVLAIHDAKGEPVKGPVASCRDSKFLYEHGAVVAPDKWDPDPRVECSSGIHFFLTRYEAETYA